MYMTFVDELLYLPLYLLGFLGVDAVRSLVWKWCAGYEVDAVFDSAKWR